jgi:hypothetical protein
MSGDPCLDAALAFTAKQKKLNRPSVWRRLWNWYKGVTGYEAAVHVRLWKNYLEATKGERK